MRHMQEDEEWEGAPLHHAATSKGRGPVFDKKELNKIFKGEHSAVSRNWELKIFCGKPGSEGPGLGREVEEAASRAEQSGPRSGLEPTRSMQLSASRQRPALPLAFRSPISQTRPPPHSLHPEQSLSSCPAGGAGVGDRPDGAPYSSRASDMRWHQDPEVFVVSMSGDQGQAPSRPEGPCPQPGKGGQQGRGERWLSM